MKFLLILHMGPLLDLEKVGIPKSVQENGSKIVLFAVSKQVCQEMVLDQMMSLDDIFFWELFCQNMSEGVHSAEIQATARKIVELCRHSSHAIIPMAGALQNVMDVSIWKSVVEKLSLLSSSDEENLDELISNVLTFSIENLEDDRTKNRLKNLSFRNITSTIFVGSLEYLHLYYVQKLQTIWEGPMNRGCLSKLKNLSLQTCPKLASVLTKGMIDNLCILEELVVEDCPTIASLITHESFILDLTSFYLPKLKRMLLDYLPSLSSISSGLRITPKLEYLSFYNCPNLEFPSYDEASSKKLRKIRGEKDWWKDLARQDNLVSLFVAIGSNEVV